MNGNLWFSTDLQDCIEDTVQKLMNPTSNFSPKDPGLLLGKIQSGKTRAFVGILGLMFDKDIDIAIVLTKGTKALAQQTKTRMEDEFSAFASRRVPGRPHVDVSDILNRRNGYSVRELNDKNIIICKKEKNKAKKLKLDDYVKLKSDDDINQFFNEVNNNKNSLDCFEISSKVFKEYIRK